MSDRFADYAPDVSGAPVDAQLRPATVADIEDCLRIGALIDRDGDLDRRRAGLTKTVQGEDGRLVVAEVDGQVVGYGRIRRLDRGGQLPTGWYLVGAAVQPDYRRRGIGRALTGARLDWLWTATGADRCWYFANSSNRASIDLHSEFGFVETARDITVPGVDFVDGTGVLFVVNRP